MTVSAERRECEWGGGVYLLESPPTFTLLNMQLNERQNMLKNHGFICAEDSEVFRLETCIVVVVDMSFGCVDLCVGTH